MTTGTTPTTFLLLILARDLGHKIFSLKAVQLYSLEAVKPNETGQTASFRPSLWTQILYIHSLQLQQMRLTF